MWIFLLALVSYSQPGDTNIYGGMDANIAQFSRYWENVYETSPSGFRTTQGCLDLVGWYQLYEAKTEAAFNKTFSLRYRFQMIRDYEYEITEHRFEPTMRLGGDFYTHLVVAPYFLKEHDEAGIGFSWRDDYTDWVAVYGILQAFDHNFSLLYRPPGPRNDPFRRIPLKLELDARKEFDWMRLRLHTELGTRAEQYLVWPDSAWSQWERTFDRSMGWGRLELRPLKGVWVGTRFSARRTRSRTLWPARAGADSLTADTLLNYWVEPFLSFSPSRSLELRLEYRIWDTYQGTDSLTYFRDWDILSTSISWQPLPVLVVETGYQRSLRYRYLADTLILEPYSGRHYQSRILFNLELRLKSGMMLTIKEGIETDFFPRDFFRSPHNHTYVSLHLPLTVFSSPEEDQQNER